MSAAMYDSAVARFALGQVDWEGATVKVMLATDRYEPSQTTDESRADIGSAEVQSSGSYARGGTPLGGRSVVRGEFGGDVRLMAGKVEWTDFTGEFRYAIVYQAVGAADEDPVIAYTDLGRQEATNARVTLEYDRDGGVAEFTVQPTIGGRL